MIPCLTTLIATVIEIKTVQVLNVPGTTSTDLVNKMDDILVDKSQSLIVHVVPHKRCESSQQC